MNLEEISSKNFLVSRLLPSVFVLSLIIIAFDVLSFLCIGVPHKAFRFTNDVKGGRLYKRTFEDWIRSFEALCMYMTIKRFRELFTFLHNVSFCPTSQNVASVLTSII